MRKIIIRTTFILIILIFSSCSKGGSRTEMLKIDNDGKKADARLEFIIKALTNQDKEALKTVFSKQALEEADDFDGSMDYLFEFFLGEVENWKRTGLSSDESTDYGKVIKMIRSWYKVTTNKDEYLFFMLEYAEDTEHSDNVGVYALRVIKAEKKETQFTYWQDMATAGIYRPEE